MAACRPAATGRALDIGAAARSAAVLRPAPEADHFRGRHSQAISTYHARLGSKPDFASKGPLLAGSSSAGVYKTSARPSNGRVADYVYFVSNSAILAAIRINDDKNEVKNWFRDSLRRE
jgi:hypothetical protein